MSNEKHSPGPWTVGYQDDSGRFRLDSIDGCTFAIVDANQNSVLHAFFTKENEADANLISAAPEMLEFLEWLDEHRRDPQDKVLLFMQIPDRIEEIISKARGKK